MNLVLLYKNINLPSHMLEEKDIWSRLKHIEIVVKREVQPIYIGPGYSMDPLFIPSRSTNEATLYFSANHLTPDEHMILSNLCTTDFEFEFENRYYIINNPYMIRTEINFESSSYDSIFKMILTADYISISEK